MTSWQDHRRSPSEYVTVRTIWVAVALSLLLVVVAAAIVAAVYGRDQQP